MFHSEVTQSLKNSEQLYERWRVLLDSPATAGGQEYDWVTGELKNSLKSIEWDLEDLDETIHIRSCVRIVSLRDCTCSFCVVSLCGGLRVGRVL